MDGGAQDTIVHGVAKCWTPLNNVTIPYVCLLSFKKKNTISPILELRNSSEIYIYIYIDENTQKINKATKKG